MASVKLYSNTHLVVVNIPLTLSSHCRMMEIRFSENVRVYKTENENYYFTVS